MGIGQADGPATGARFGRGPATAPPGFLRAHGGSPRGGAVAVAGVGKDLTSPKPPSDLFAEPSRAEPSRAEPSRAEPSRAEPSRAEPSRAEPSRAEPSRAEPSRAEPSRAEPSRAEPRTAPRARRRAHSRPEPQYFFPRPLRAAASGLTRHHTPSGVDAGSRPRDTPSAHRVSPFADATGEWPGLPRLSATALPFTHEAQAGITPVGRVSRRRNPTSDPTRPSRLPKLPCWSLA